MKKNVKNRIPGILIATLLVVALTLFMAILIKTKLLPAKFLLMAGGIFLLFAVSVFFLTRNSERVGCMIAGCLLTMVVLIVLVLGTPYLMRAVDTLDKITATEVEVADVGLYVKADSSITQLSDVAGGELGIMQSLDRENTEKALEDLLGQIGTLQVQEYAGLGELIDGLMEGETDAILLNSAYLDLLEDMEGYADAAGQLREIYIHKAQTLIQNPQEESNKDSWNILDMFGEEKDDEAEVDKGRVFTMYISGIDSRSGLIAKSRSDVNIIATVNVDTRQVLLVSTPRDYYVPLPISNGIPDKLTHAGIYGIDVSMGTLEMLYGTDIDYYFRVNFSGFEKIIDALGGITVNSDMAFKSSYSAYSFKKGENHLDGEAALAFARERKNFSTGDRQRGKNQMAVIKAVIQKAMSPAILTGYADIMDSVSGSFETSMPYDVIAELVRDQLDKGGSWNIVSCSVDGTGDTKIPYSMSTGAYVMIPDQATVDAAVAKINQVKNGEILE